MIYLKTTMLNLIARLLKQSHIFTAPVFILFRKPTC